jgi:hypothetical protein
MFKQRYKIHNNKLNIVGGMLPLAYIQEGQIKSQKAAECMINRE